ncbi:hypothetical protein AWB69_03479 [Caballeronia udeis]|uniref:Uncharacterized protein n=1 Tax=Caballeronia udeis TaxID=1232866 RepID=A0A158GWG2_9BURK|nr:hypothetical protein AWB69_03479 [Caballeronia udeis]
MTDNLPDDSWGDAYRCWLAELKQRVERAAGPRPRDSEQQEYMLGFSTISD